MKSIYLLAAATLAIAAPAAAQAADKPMSKDTAASVDSSSQYYVNTEKTDFQASNLIGSRIYATQVTVDADKPVDKVATDWNDIGEINNIVIGKDGSVKAVVLGVGGFLSIGEKNVAVRMSELKFVKKQGADANDYYIVVKSDKASLEKAPTYTMTE